jgi:hypothetical protein
LLVVAVTEPNGVFLLDKLTGDVTWTWEGYTYSAFAYDPVSDTLFFPDDSGVVALSLSEPIPMKKWHTTPDVRGCCQYLFYQDGVLAIFPDNIVVGLTSSGETKWETGVNQPGAYNDGLAASLGNVLFWCGPGSIPGGFDVQTGHPLWGFGGRDSFNFISCDSTTAGEKLFYTVYQGWPPSATATLIGFEPQSGSIAFKKNFTTLASTVYNRLVVTEKVVFVSNCLLGQDIAHPSCVVTSIELSQ